MKANKIRIEGFCKSSPEVLSIMDTIHLSVRYNTITQVLDLTFNNSKFLIYALRLKWIYCYQLSHICGITTRISYLCMSPHGSVHINNLMIQKHHQMSLRSTNVAMEDLPVQPLPTLFRFLGLIPFKKVPTCDLGLLL